VVSTVCAVALTANRLYGSFFAAPATVPPTKVANWEAIAAEGHRMGPPDSPVTIVEFSDFLCPFCQRQAPVLDSIRHEYPREVAIVYRHFPTPTPGFARAASIASECAARAGKFEPYHDLLLSQPDSLGLKSWAQLALQVGVRDTVTFGTCMNEPAVAAIVDRDKAVGESIEVLVTPTLLVNDVMLTGHTEAEELRTYIEAALARTVSH